jgi:hypothetical protein
MLDGNLAGIMPWQVSGVGIYKAASQRTFDDFDIYPEKTVGGRRSRTCLLY